MQKNSAEPRKLTTREVTDSKLLMIMISSCGGENSRTAERVTQTVDAELRSKSTDTPVYDVRVSINGIELDFRDFAAEGLWRFFTACRELLFRHLPKIFSRSDLNIFRPKRPGIAR